MSNIRKLTSILSTYGKTGQISKARQLFDSMAERNVVSWNAMITAYIQNGDTRSARCLFDHMPESLRDAISWNTIITAYSHANAMDKARYLFDAIPPEKKTIVSWTIVISGYVQIANFHQGWELFVTMYHGVVSATLDHSILLPAISSVVGLGDHHLLDSLRSLAIKVAFEGDVVVGTAFLIAYTKNNEVKNTMMDTSAGRFFSWMPERNDFTWSTMIAASSQLGHIDDSISYYNKSPQNSIACQSAMISSFARAGRINDAHFLFDKIPYPNVLLCNTMIAGYTQNNMMDLASKLFYAMPIRNPISWAAMIAGFAQNGRYCEALQLFSDLHRRKEDMPFPPQHSCYTSALLACSYISGDSGLEHGRQIHTLVVKTGCQFNTFICNGLISMYSKCDSFADVNQMFEKMKVKDTVSWNCLITGLANNNMVADAHAVFERMPNRDIVSWTSIISAYGQSGGHETEALSLFMKMQNQSIKPNSSTLATMISVCADLGATGLGQQFHSLAVKLGSIRSTGTDDDIFISNALITMYFKCGVCRDSFQVFDEMSDHDIVTWNAILTGCAHQGFGMETIRLFDQMKSEGVVYPNHITFLAMMCACSHAGLVDEGFKYFDSMSRDYSLMPSTKHYACMVDLLGRAGRLTEAEEFIDAMPIEPDSVVWGALLGASRIFQNMKSAEKASERLLEMDPHNSGTYVLLSNMYASVGMWDEAGEVRKLMRERGVVKEAAGSSWMYVNNRLYSFFTNKMAGNGNDDGTQKTEEIVGGLKEMYVKLISGSGYVPNTSFALHDVEEEQKIEGLLGHSEKLAVVFGLMNTKEGSPIRIMKNLRICGDCHTFMKLVSKETGRLINVRDRNRFHHFEHGNCSCGDYW